MRLSVLEPAFIKYEDRIETWDKIVGDEATWRERGCPTEPVTGPREHRITVPSLAEAQGIHFLCPKCWTENKGPVGTHLCEVTFEGRGVLPHQGIRGSKEPGPRWNVTGTNFEDLSTTPSILIIGGCNWHGYITAGEVSIL
jgi:uncharacterized protein DUF6527